LTANHFSRWPAVAARLLFQMAEETKTSTSSFRSPGGPTPTRGLFFGRHLPTRELFG
jgi:hypothetical protein